MIMVQSTFFLVDETKNDALELMKTMVDNSRREEGCVSYEYFAGITEQNQVVLLQGGHHLLSLGALRKEEGKKRKVSETAFPVFGH